VNKRRLILLTVIVILVAVVLFAGRWLRTYDLKAERAAARAAGIPLSESENPLPAISAADDAVPLYDKLTALREVEPPETKRPRPASEHRGGSPRVESTEELRALITAKHEILRVIHTAAAKPHARIDVAPENNQLIPRLTSMRQAAIMIRWESELMAREGRYVEAVRNEAISLRIANQCLEQQVLLTQLTSFAIEAIAMSGFRDLLEEAGERPGVAEAVRDEVTSYRSNRDFSRFIAGETLDGLGTVRRIDHVRKVPAPQAHPLWIPHALGLHAATRGYFADASEAVWLHWMTRYMAASRRPISERNDAIAQVDREFQEATAATRERRMAAPAFHFAMVRVRMFREVAGSASGAATKRAVIATAASVLAYRARHGKYPATLEQAGAPQPVDYQTNRPLEYKFNGNAFEIAAHPDTSGLEPERARSLTESLRFQYPPGAK
jgi:hypothetical protein